jgi:hypothetical protein
VPIGEWMLASQRRSLVRAPWEWIIPGLVVAPWIAIEGGSANLSDTQYFVVAGRTLLSGHWAAAFSSPRVQAGPFELALYGAFGRLSALSGIGVGRLLAPVVELGVVALVVAVVGRLLADEPMRRAVQGTVGTLAAVAGVPSMVFTGGHPADAVIPLLWLLAGDEARRGRDLRAVLIVGLSANVELWGALGAPVLLLVAHRRRILGDAALLVGVTLGPLVPFALAGSVRMFHYRWLVSKGSLVGLFLTPGATFPWTLRLLQGALALAAGAAVAWRMRRRDFSVCAVPLAIVGVRLLLDPELGFSYYFAAWIELALVAAGWMSCRLLSPHDGRLRRPAPAVAVPET